MQKEMMRLIAISAVDLRRLATGLGIRLVEHTGGIPGWYHHRTRTISTRRGMSFPQYRSVLAHELGHAIHNDVPTGHGHFDARQERRADKFAANLLINQDAFEAAATCHSGHLPAIADELEVTNHLLGVWLEHHPQKGSQ